MAMRPKHAFEMKDGRMGWSTFLPSDVTTETTSRHTNADIANAIALRFGTDEGQRVFDMLNSQAALLAACEAFLRAPSVGSRGMGSVSIEVQTYNLDAARSAIAQATGREVQA